MFQDKTTMTNKGILKDTTHFYYSIEVHIAVLSSKIVVLAKELGQGIISVS